MSFYATISGTLVYETQEAFDHALKLLVDGHWLFCMEREIYFLDEDDERISPEDKQDVDFENRIIHIPFGFYRSLTHLLCTKTFDDKPGLLAGSKGKVVWTSTDGCFSGGVITDSEEKVYDLEKWNSENNGENPPDFEVDFDGYCDWQTNIEVDFFNAFEN
jgi:hypothetical protein